MAFGHHVMIGAVGVDAEGHKPVLVIREAAGQNKLVVLHRRPPWSISARDWETDDN